MSLGSFGTIPKVKRNGPLDRTSYRFLDAIHMDIAFGDCVSVGVIAMLSPWLIVRPDIIGPSV